ncbi:MAG: DUF4097 family beta strand repeat-containing protein [Bacteroidota bacterium]
MTHAVALDGRTLVLQAEAGRIEVVAHDTATVATVQVVRTARGATDGSARQRLQRGEVVRVDGDDEIVQIIAPAPQPPGIETSFTASVPRDAVLHLQLEAGPITVGGVAGAFVTALTDAGVIQATGLAAQTVTLSAEDGTIDADVVSLPPDGRLTATVGSGTVDVWLPSDAEVSVVAESTTGTVRADGLDELQRSQTDAGQRVTGRLGTEPAAEVDVRAGVGRVTVRGR